MDMVRTTRTIKKLATLGVVFAAALSIRCSSTPPLVPAGAQLEKLSGGEEFHFLEGPTWVGNALYFTDIAGNSIVRLGQGEMQRVNTSSNRSNGLFFDAARGNIIACVGGAGLVAILSLEGEFIDTLTSTFNGKPFNSPNDLIMDSQRGIYFTDPTWAKEYPQPHKGVYYITSQGDVRLLINDLDKPNGIILSPNQETLYVNDSHSPTILAFDVIGPGEISNRRVFASLDMEGIEGNISGADGMAIDSMGNLFVTFRRGVQVFSPSGQSIALIKTPETPTNCTFGGECMSILFVTAGTNLYSIKLNTIGMSYLIP